MKLKKHVVSLVLIVGIALPFGLSLLNGNFWIGALIVLSSGGSIFNTIMALVSDINACNSQMEYFKRFFPKADVGFWDFFEKSGREIDTIIDQVQASKEPGFPGDPLEPVDLLRRKRKK